MKRIGIFITSLALAATVAAPTVLDAQARRTQAPAQAPIKVFEGAG